MVIRLAIINKVVNTQGSKDDSGVTTVYEISRYILSIEIVILRSNAKVSAREISTEKEILTSF